MTLHHLPYSAGDIFPAGDFAFHMKFRRGEIAAFYRNGADPAILRGRRKWLAEDPGKYAAALPESEALLAEATEMARGLGVDIPAGTTPGDSITRLGEAWEPDILLLRAAPPTAQPVLLAGAVCFPSSWALEEKIGEPLDAIHRPVPTLNEQFATPVRQFLARMKPGISWERINWGLSRSPELNQHPSRNLPRLDEGAKIEAVWFRAEYQSLVLLPRTGGVLFGIRLAIEPLTQLIQDGAFAQGLARALRTMPEGIAQYKGLAAAREPLVRQLG